MTTAKINYLGTTPGADSQTYTLFNTAPLGSTNNASTGGMPKGFMASSHSCRLVADIKNAGGNGTLKLYKSKDRGVTWLQVDEIAVTAPAANATNVYDFLVEEYDDVRLDWVNGGAAQTTWAIDLALSDSRNPAV